MGTAVLQFPPEPADKILALERICVNEAVVTIESFQT